MTSATSTVAAPPRATAQVPSANLGPATVGGLAIALAAIDLTASVSPRQASLFLVGVAAGIVLYHAAFGFTSSWRGRTGRRRRRPQRCAAGLPPTSRR
jgi:hypothetical protein